MRDRDAVIAFNRFGLGPRPGDLKRVGSDPRGAVLVELQNKRAALIETSEALVSSADAVRLLQQYQEAYFQYQRKKAEAKDLKSPLNPLWQIFQAEANARFKKQAETPLGLTERLVLFWSNHFSVASAKGYTVQVMIGAFEREAIRTHILGRFRDMLRAVEQHPAMLAYLDNNLSIGPSTQQAGGGKRGLNENLAREILELHTLGVDGGYTQNDVTSLARIITGWTFTAPMNDIFHGGRFTFAFGRHEPGDHALLGRVFPDGGVEQGEAALDFLAQHPATARHIARKMASHFVSDDPPPQLISRLEKTFLDTDGDLGAVTHALVSSAEAWQEEAHKLRLPIEFVVAAERLVGRPQNFNPIPALASLGQPLWNPPSPKGFPDSQADWNTPAGLKGRLDIAARMAAGAATHDPKILLEEAFGSAVSRETREAVQRAESRVQGLAILLMSPEFQRR